MLLYLSARIQNPKCITGPALKKGGKSMNYEQFCIERARREREQQQAEIATIRPRSFTLNLSDADVERLFEKAYSNGITPADLLEGFIGDLVGGTYSHGSDERLYAQQYFDRCNYGDGSESWLAWSLYNCEYSDIEDYLSVYESCLEEMEDPIPDEQEKIKELFADAEAKLKEIYDSYVAEMKYRSVAEPQPYSEALQAVIDYRAELKCMKEGRLATTVENKIEGGETS